MIITANRDTITRKKLISNLETSILFVFMIFIQIKLDNQSGNNDGNKSTNYHYKAEIKFRN